MRNGEVIAVIPARGGSKSVPDKNLKRLDGTPLVAWPIKTAKKVQAIDEIIVTTDDERIAAVSEEYGARVVDRPAELATDEALVIDAIRHLRDWIHQEDGQVDYFVVLEPTSPLRTADDVRRCLQLLLDEQEAYDSVATFTEAQLNPHRTWSIHDGVPEPFIGEADPWLPRQQQPEAYELTGAVYAFEARKLGDEGNSLLFDHPGAVLMPQSRSVDIDTINDFKLAQLLVSERISDD